MCSAKITRLARRWVSLSRKETNSSFRKFTCADHKCSAPFAKDLTESFQKGKQTFCHSGVDQSDLRLCVSNCIVFLVLLLTSSSDKTHRQLLQFTTDSNFFFLLFFCGFQKQPITSLPCLPHHYHCVRGRPGFRGTNPSHPTRGAAEDMYAVT